MDSFSPFSPTTSAGDRVEELNRRMSDRFFPSCFINPVMNDCRATPTRYVHFPVQLRAPCVDPSSSPSSGGAGKLEYTPENCFAPNVKNPPDFARKVDVETNLRNQYFALQRGADQSIYVPATTSDLYQQQQARSLESSGLLGKDRDLSAVTNWCDILRHSGGGTLVINNTVIGTDALNNNTRTQLRNSYSET